MLVASDARVAAHETLKSVATAPVALGAPEEFPGAQV